MRLFRYITFFLLINVACFSQAALSGANNISNTTTIIDNRSELAGTVFSLIPFAGQCFFRTDLGDQFCWDASRNKWLGHSQFVSAGDNGGLNDNQAFRLYDRMQTGGDKGFRLMHDYVVVAMSANWGTPNSATGIIELLVNNTVVHSSNFTNADNIFEMGLDIFIPAFDVWSFRLQNTTLNNTQLIYEIKNTTLNNTQLIYEIKKVAN